MEGAGDVMPGTFCWNLTSKGAPDKGTMAMRLCAEVGCDSLVYFGDETTDERVFRLHTPPLFAVKVGGGETCAPYRLAGPDQVLVVLEQFVAAARC